MKIDCGIIKDLMPLYEDAVCTEESRKAVEKHLEECDACRELYRRTSEVMPKLPAGEMETAEEGKRFKKGLRKIRRRWAYSLAAALLFVPLIFMSVAQVLGEGICFTSIGGILESYYYLELLKNGEYGKAFDRVDWEEIWKALTDYDYVTMGKMVRDRYQAIEIDGEVWMFSEDRIQEFFDNGLPVSLEGEKALRFWEAIYQHTEENDIYLIPAYAFDALNLQVLYEEAKREMAPDFLMDSMIQEPLYVEIQGKDYYMGMTPDYYNSREPVDADINRYFSEFVCIPDTVWEKEAEEEEQFRAEYEQNAEPYLKLGYEGWLAECRKRFVETMEEWERTNGRIEKIRFKSAYNNSDSDLRAWQIGFDLTFSGQIRSEGGITLFTSHGKLSDTGSGYAYGGTNEEFWNTKVQQFTDCLRSPRIIMIFRDFGRIDSCEQ